MAPDYPSDLIQDIKIRLRQAAGVPSYDPGDSALLSFPSVADAVSALDPTLPDYLRCKRCHGGLFRGIKSSLCIFCGAEQRGDGNSRTISFNSTEGYRKLLQSLDLDGSEVVNLEAGSKESSKGRRDSPKGGMALANILNLELRWPREVEDIDNNSSNKAPSQVALVSLSGVDLDHFFSYQKNEVSSRSHNSHSTSNAPPLSAHRANSFSVDFEASGVEQFIPREQGVDIHVDLSSRSQKFGFIKGWQSLDVVNSSADAKDADLDDAFADWKTDFQSASSATFEAKPKQIDPAQSSEDFQSANPAAESRTIDLFDDPVISPSVDFETAGAESKQIIPFKSSSNFQLDNPTSLAMELRTNDLFQEDMDIQSANSEAAATDSRPIDQIQNPSADFSPIIISKSDQNTNIVPNSNKVDTGKDLTREVDQLASLDDRLQDDMQSQISTKASKRPNQLESLSSNLVGEHQKEKEETTLSVHCSRDDSWQSSANEINNMESLNHGDDDLFDDWQDFTAATAATAANSGDAEDFEFGCFVQSDSFSVALNDRQSSNHRVDILLAQMPDLSFMLEDSLCIPKMPGGSELNTLDSQSTHSIHEI